MWSNPHKVNLWRFRFIQVCNYLRHKIKIHFHSHYHSHIYFVTQQVLLVVLSVQWLNKRQLHDAPPPHHLFRHVTPIPLPPCRVTPTHYATPDSIPPHHATLTLLPLHCATLLLCLSLPPKV